MSKTSLIDDGRIGSFSHRRECPEGQEFVESYRRKDGVRVEGYCRDLPDITLHDRQQDRMNLRGR